MLLATEDLPATNEGLAEVEDALSDVEDGLEGEGFRVGAALHIASDVDRGSESGRSGDSGENENKEGGGGTHRDRENSRVVSEKKGFVKSEEKM